MVRITKQILQYISEQKKKAKQMYCVKNLKQEVNIGANGTQKYVIKKGGRRHFQRNKSHIR